MTRIVEVLPDVSGIDRAFAYVVPDELSARIGVGSIVRVVLHGRRVRGWVVAEASDPPEIELRSVDEVASYGPPPEVVGLGRWVAWRYAGRLRPVLVAASPPRLVRRLAPAPAKAPAQAQPTPASPAKAPTPASPAKAPTAQAQPTPPAPELGIAAATLSGSRLSIRRPAAAAGGAPSSRR